MSVGRVGVFFTGLRIFSVNTKLRSVCAFCLLRGRSKLLRMCGVREFCVSCLLSRGWNTLSLLANSGRAHVMLRERMMCRLARLAGNNYAHQTLSRAAEWLPQSPCWRQTVGGSQVATTACCRPSVSCVPRCVCRGGRGCRPESRGLPLSSYPTPL